MKYLVHLNYFIVAENEKIARRQALKMLRVKELLPGVVSPVDVFNQLEEVRNSDKENFVVLFLNTQNGIIGKDIVSIGTLNTSLVHPREVFRTAIVKNCASIIVAHNHPSGSLEPSSEDLAVTQRLKESGKLLGIELLDHVIDKKKS
jgi:DNA repair protein RadC